MREGTRGTQRDSDQHLCPASSFLGMTIDNAGVARLRFFFSRSFYSFVSILFNGCCGNENLIAGVSVAHARRRTTKRNATMEEPFEIRSRRDRTHEDRNEAQPRFDNGPWENRTNRTLDIGSGPDKRGLALRTVRRMEKKNRLAVGLEISADPATVTLCRVL